MSKRQHKTGDFVRLELPDGSFGYGRLRDFPIAAFYKLRTEAPLDDLDQIAEVPVLFTVAVHKSVHKNWQKLGNRPLEPKLQEPFRQFWQKAADPRNCQIVDTAGNQRAATPQECVGMERVAVWEAEHVESRILDEMSGRENVFTKQLEVKIA